MTKTLRYVLVMMVLCVAASVEAQSFCRTVTHPYQGVDPATGTPLLNTQMDLPPNSESYPIAVQWPAGATRVSIVKWTSWVPTTSNGMPVPVGSVQFREYIDTFPWPAGALHNAQVVGIITNNGDGHAETFAESTPLSPNEQYVVWVGNSNSFWVSIHLAIHVLECY